MLVLASQSPRRRELLTRAGIEFVIRVREVDETPLPAETALAYVCRLAEAKARAVECAPGEVVLGADTTVVVDSEILAKPENAADARRMLTLLSGRRHEVITGICLRRGEGVTVDAATTEVWFSPMSDAEIDSYVASGEPMDKAGAYAIQGLASKFIERIAGCHFNIVGLPVSLVYRHLQQLGAI